MGVCRRGRCRPRRSVRMALLPYGWCELAEYVMRLERSQAFFRIAHPAPRSHLRQTLGGVAKLVEAHVHLVHHRQVQPAHLPFRLLAVIEHAAGLNPAAARGQPSPPAAASRRGWPVSMLEQNKSIELSSAVRSPFLDRVQLARDVRHLLDEELVHLQPVGRVASATAGGGSCSPRPDAGSAATNDRCSASAW